MAKNIKMQEIDSVSRSIIMIDEKNLNVYVRDYTDKIKKRGDCWGFLCAFISSTMTLVSSTFTNWLLPSDTWFGIFLMLDLLFFIFFCKSLFWSYKARKSTPDNLIEDIKKFQQQSNTQIQVSDF